MVLVSTYFLLKISLDTEGLLLKLVKVHNIYHTIFYVTYFFIQIASFDAPLVEEQDFFPVTEFLTLDQTRLMGI